MNKEVNISRYTANKIVKDYYNDYYDNIVNIKTKIKLNNDGLSIIVKKYTKLNKKAIYLTETINEEKISFIIKEYMKKYDCYIDNIIFEPYFYNLNIRYHGNNFNFNLNNKKKREKVLVA